MSFRENHRAVFYRSSDALFSEVSAFLTPGLTAHQPTLIVATPSHLRGILAALSKDHVDVESAITSRELTVANARHVLSSVLRSGALDLAACREVFTPLFHSIARQGPDTHLWAYGELVDLLWRRNRPDDALMLELFWNSFPMPCRCSMLCGYFRRRAADAELYTPAVVHQHAATIDARKR